MQISDEASVSEAISTATETLCVKGGGTRVEADDACDVLDVSGLSGITLYEPGALTLVAKAGTPVSEIETALAGEGQRLAFEPTDLTRLLGSKGDSTLGGVAATNASGSRRIQAGAARDFMLGVRFVDGRGQVISNGGRVMKNVTGYDLVKLLAGSYGTLGVLTEVSLKVMPKPETETTLVLNGLTAEAALDAMSQALGSPYDVTGAAHVPGAEAATYIRLEGFEPSVDYRSGALRERLKAFGEVSEAESPWKDLTDAAALADHPGDVWRISVKPSDGPKVVGALPENAKWFMDWGGGLIWASVVAGTDLRALLSGISGHATLVRANPGGFARFGRFQPEAGPVKALSAGLRAKFDPRGLFRAPLKSAA